MAAKSCSIKSYFESKRDLIDKWNNKNERNKKVRENSLVLSLSKETNDDPDVFTEAIESPRCAIILYDCSKNLESKVNKIYELFSSTKDAQIKNTRPLEEVSEPVKFIIEKFDKYEVDRKEKKKISRIKRRLVKQSLLKFIKP